MARALPDCSREAGGSDVTWTGLRRGLLHLAIGAAPAIAVAGLGIGMTVTALQDRGAARVVTLVLIAVAVAVVLSLLLAAPVRAAAITLARLLLGVDLPDAGEARDREGRINGLVWAVLAMTIGALALLVVLILIPAGAWLSVLPLVGGDLQVAGTRHHVTRGEDWWLTAVGVAALCLGAAAPVAGVRMLRHLAPRWLGPTAGDRLHEEQRRTLRLARGNALARDLHDSIGHALTAIGVQADAALSVGERDPAFARRALEAIRDSAHGAVGDLDRVLGVLRAEGDRTPANDEVAQLHALLKRLPEDRVDLSVTGDPDLLRAEVSHAAYGIVREAVTNAVRHGTGSVTARIAIADTVTIEVANDLPAAHDAVSRTVGGRGRESMRERALLVGGTCTSGVRGARWVVDARLPCEGRS